MERYEPVTVEVDRAWVTPHTHHESLTVLYEDGGLIKRDIVLDSYIIKSVTLYDSESPGGYTENYGTAHHEQMEAFSMLEQACQEYETITMIGTRKKEESEMVALGGPRRVEITLRATMGAVEKKHLLLDIMPPKDAFHLYSVNVRAFLPSKRLSHQRQTLSSTQYWLVKVDEFHGGAGGCTTRNFDTSQQIQAWSVAEKAYYKLHIGERKVLQNWYPPVATHLQGGQADTYGDVWAGQYSSQHWNLAQSAHVHGRPEPAHFRAAGDVAGRGIHEEQQATWEKQGALSPEESLERMLARKEPVAETKATFCSECGKTGCPDNYCMEEVDASLTLGLGGTIGFVH